MIYLPVDDFSSFYCYSVLDKDTIRAYNNDPILNQNISYTDFFINSHYLTKTGSELIQSVPVCINNDLLTNDVYYRNDLPDILIIFLIISIFAFYIPFRVVLRFFKKSL